MGESFGVRRLPSDVVRWPLVLLLPSCLPTISAV